MGRVSTFICGMICGAGLLWGAMHYHVVRSDDGVYLVPKLSNNLKQAYVDIRGFTISDWQQNRTLAAAIIRNEKSHLLGDTSLNQFKGRIISAIDELLGTPRPET